MQLYLVEFQVHWEGRVDLGRAVVLATSSEEAVKALIKKHELPFNRCEFKAELIEDGIMNIARRSVSKPDAAKLSTVPERERPHLPSIDFNCQILAVCRGQDESHVLKRLAHTVINRANEQAGEQDKHVSRLMISCEPRVQGHEKMRPMEAFETYKGKGLIR